MSIRTCPRQHAENYFAQHDICERNQPAERSKRVVPPVDAPQLASVVTVATGSISDPEADFFAFQLPPGCEALTLDRFRLAKDCRELPPNKLRSRLQRTESPWRTTQPSRGAANRSFSQCVGQSTADGEIETNSIRWKEELGFQTGAHCSPLKKPRRLFPVL